MNQPTETVLPVPPEEVERRIEEYRRVCWERKVTAQVVYHDADLPCPWPSCGLGIAGIRFQLEKMADQAMADRWLSAWWQGPGLVGRCPRCGYPVLFGLLHKQAVADPLDLREVVFPEDWDRKAHLVIRSAE